MLRSTLHPETSRRTTCMSSCDSRAAPLVFNRRQPCKKLLLSRRASCVRVAAASCSHFRSAAHARANLQRSRASVAGGKLRSAFGVDRSLAGQRIAIFSCRRGRKTIVSATLVEAEGAVDAEAILDQKLTQHTGLVQGTLANGLKYVILPNKVPPNRFEAHLEIHAGSVDEKGHEQGVAHLVEHVTFLGSHKREGLLGTGARSNAYTDFHHTVFHVHSPLSNANLGTPMLPQVLDALTEIAFEPEFLTTRIEKERRAVLAEAQMMNTIEYRVDCQLLQYLHEENALGCRFPIGKTDQVKTWSPDVLKGFWERWYFPANATLYVVGELDRGVEATRQLIEQTFGRVAEGRHRVEGAVGNGSVPLGDLKTRHAVRPPVEHRFGDLARTGPAGLPAAVQTFRHRLLQHFSLSVFCKLPVRPMGAMRDLRHAFLVRVMVAVLQFRVNGRYVRGDPPFIGIELDHSDSGREGCTVSTLTITSEPKDWRGAVQVAVQEVRRLQKYGVTPNELERYKTALLRDSQQLAEQAGSVPSLDNLDFVMESLALGHTVMDQKESHEKLMQLAGTITLPEVNAICASLLSFVSHYGHEERLLAEAASGEQAFAPPGPTAATSIVACVPAFMDASGNSTGGAAPMQRGASMTTTQHVDPAEAARIAAQDLDAAGDVPEGAVRFEIEAADIAAELAAESVEVEAAQDIEVPEALLPDDAIEELMAELQPRFVPPPGAADPLPGPDPHSGILQRRLSNGIRINARHTDNEPSAAMLRMVAAGGRAAEGEGPGPAGTGAVSVGTRTLSESGTVGRWQREQVELFCISKLINCVFEADEEFLVMDFHFAVGDGGLPAVLGLLHLFLEQPRWEGASMERAKQMYASHFRALAKGLERATADRLMTAMLGKDRRFRDANVDEIDALTLEGMCNTISAQLHAGNLEINLVGDFDVLALDELLLRYLGTIRPRDGATRPALRPIRILPQPMELMQQEWHLKDSDERAVAYIAGQAPGRWSFGAPLPAETVPNGSVTPPVLAGEANGAGAVDEATAERVRRSHPLYASVTLSILTEVMNSRLFTTVRDQLNLTYDVSFELSLFDQLNSGWFCVNVTSTPQKIREALNASLDVLRRVAVQRITPRELQRAKRTILTRHESDLKDNVYWLGLMTHLQSDAVPLKCLDCLRDIRAMHEAVTVADVYDAYSRFRLDEQHVFTCIGTSGTQPLPPPQPRGAGAASGPAGLSKLDQLAAENPVKMLSAMNAAARILEAISKGK